MKRKIKWGMACAILTIFFGWMSVQVEASETEGSAGEDVRITSDNFNEYFKLNGNATWNQQNSLVTLTEDRQNQSGNISLKKQMDTARDFTIKGKVQLGSKLTGNRGADGIGIALHEGELNQIGGAGNALGVDGLPNAFAYVIDTYRNRGDSTVPYGAFIRTNRSGTRTGLEGSQRIPTTVAGVFCDFELVYLAQDRTFNVSLKVSNTRTMTWKVKLNSTTNFLTLSISASTGSSSNLQQFQLEHIDFRVFRSFTYSLKNFHLPLAEVSKLKNDQEVRKRASTKAVYADNGEIIEDSSQAIFWKDLQIDEQQRKKILETGKAGVYPLDMTLKIDEKNAFKMRGWVFVTDQNTLVTQDQKYISYAESFDYPLFSIGQVTTQELLEKGQPRAYLLQDNEQVKDTLTPVNQQANTTLAFQVDEASYQQLKNSTEASEEAYGGAPVLTYQLFDRALNSNVAIVRVKVTLWDYPTIFHIQPVIESTRPSLLLPKNVGIHIYQTEKAVDLLKSPYLATQQIPISKGKTASGFTTFNLRNEKNQKTIGTQLVAPMYYKIRGYQVAATKEELEKQPIITESVATVEKELKKQSQEIYLRYYLQPLSADQTISRYSVQEKATLYRVVEESGHEIIDP